MPLFMDKGKFKSVRRIAVISDSALGFGSPDIAGLCDGLCEYFGAEGLLVQPDDLNRPMVDLTFKANVRSLRLFSILPTYTRSWRWSYFRLAAQAVDKFKPDIVVAVGPNGYGVTCALKRQPKLLVYYMLEMATTEPLYKEIHQAGNGHIDCYILPEVERHDYDFGQLYWKKDGPFERILLSAPIDYPNPIRPIPISRRNGKMIYFGHIHPEETLLDNLLTPELDAYPMDFFGRIGGSDRAAIATRIAAAPGKTYRGLVTPPELAAVLPQYNYSLVTWKPEGSIARYHLPATKLYHSVLAGVPLIAVPNPLNSYYINRYGIGVLMRSATRDAFNTAIRQAAEMIGTDAYKEMVDRCLKTANGPFLWSEQVRRCARLVERQLDKKWDKLTGAKPKEEETEQKA